MVGRYKKILRWIVYITLFLRYKDQIHEGLPETLPASIKTQIIHPACSLEANNLPKFIAEEIVNVAVFSIKMNHARSIY